MRAPESIFSHSFIRIRSPLHAFPLPPSIDVSPWSASPFLATLPQSKKKRPFLSPERYFFSKCWAAPALCTTPYFNPSTGILYPSSRLPIHPFLHPDSAIPSPLRLQVGTNRNTKKKNKRLWNEFDPFEALSSGWSRIPFLINANGSRVA